MYRFTCLIAALILAGCTHLTTPTLPTSSRTRWIVEPAQAYDAIAFVNILTGDPFYVDNGYRADYERYRARLGPAEKQALSHLTQRMKIEAHQLIYPLLCLIFSGADVRTLADLRRIVRTDGAWQALRRTYAARPTAEPAELQAFDDVRADLRVLFDFLHTSDWEGMWKAMALPRVRAYIAGHAEIRGYDVVGADERVLGRRLDVPSLTAYVMTYGSPHGVRVQGWRFLTDIQYPAPVLIRTALHELLHPPFQREGELDRVLRALGQDPYFQRLVKEHNPAFGYTTAEGLIEEDCATAVHIYNTEKFGLLGQPVVDYFRKSDDGIHVLAFLLYRRLLAQTEPAPRRYEALVQEAASEILARGGLEAAFNAVPDHFVVAALRQQ